MKLAEELSNPVAPLLGVQLLSDLEWGGGPAGDGFRWILSLQPVVPFTITDDWNLILAFEHLARAPERPCRGRFAHDGVDNTTESLFLSPKKTRVRGLTWGLGPIVSRPRPTSSSVHRRSDSGRRPQ